MRLHAQLFQAFDAAVRGLSLGETTTLEAKGGEWRRDLLFEVFALPMHSVALHACLSTARPCPCRHDSLHDFCCTCALHGRAKRQLP